MKRAVRALNLGDLAPAVITSDAPEIEWVDPKSLLVDGDYQRALSEASVTLIRRIVAGWDWARFKPPVVARTEEGLEVIDGQHTATAAATHPAISIIPVIVVQAAAVADRARAFVGHNRDRLNVTKTQMHFSAVAAGDDDALTLSQVCQRAGVTILRNPPGGGGVQARRQRRHHGDRCPDQPPRRDERAHRSGLPGQGALRAGQRRRDQGGRNAAA